MLNSFLKGTAILVLALLSVILLQLPYWVANLMSEAQSIATEVHYIAVGTIVNESAIVKNLSANLNAITGEQGHLALFNENFGRTGYSLQYRLGEIETDFAAAVFGTRSQYGNRKGILGLTNSISETADKIGDTAVSTSTLENQFSESWPKLESRYLAITGEGMKTLDSWRLMSNEVHDRLPELLSSWSRMADAGAGIAEDGHTFTSKFVAKRSIGSKIWEGINAGSRLLLYAK